MTNSPAAVIPKPEPVALSPEELIAKLHAEIREFLPPEARTTFDDVMQFAQQLHSGQKRRSGEPYIIHPLEVAKILTESRMDPATIFAGVLHDVVEDTDITLEQLSARFGEECASLVDGVTKISKISFQSRHESQAENFRKMLLAMAKDLRVILIKLADRLHNMRTLSFMPEKKQVSIAQETVDIYCPLANRLGISRIKSELEDICLRYLHPDVYYAIKEKIASTKDSRNKYIQEVLSILEREMAVYQLTPKIYGRPKHFYSIYKKMEKRNVEFDQINDLLGFRIVVSDTTGCYQALGVIHSLWKPVPGRFKDYIAIPKPNMYQSLHTTVIGPYGERIEIQIRTEEMHQIAEYGIAAHWKYKHNTLTGTGKAKDEMRFNWLRQIVELQSDLKDPTEFLQTVKVNLFSDEVYVFTPKGEVKEFPKGATPVDFAYGIHTNVGNRCVGAKVNGKIVPLKYKLQDGDTIEILTKEGQGPNREWLKFVISSKAKMKIRQVIRQEQREQSRIIGKELLEKELRKQSLPVASFDKQENVDAVLEETRATSLDELYIHIGYGKLTPKQVLRPLLPEHPEPEVPAATTTADQDRHSQHGGPKDESGIKVSGIDGLLIRFGKCCSPLYGDPIVGFITRGRGVTVHTTDCPKIMDFEPERKVPVTWDKGEVAERQVKVRVVSLDTQGLLAKMSKKISDNDGNIVNANIRSTNDKKAVCVFEIGIRDTDHLHRLMKDLEKVKGIISVERCRT